MILTWDIGELLRESDQEKVREAGWLVVGDWRLEGMPRAFLPRTRGLPNSSQRKSSLVREVSVWWIPRGI